MKKSKNVQTYHVLSLSETDRTGLLILAEDMAVKLSLAALESAQQNSSAELIYKATALTNILGRLFKSTAASLEPEELHALNKAQPGYADKKVTMMIIDSALLTLIIDELDNILMVLSTEPPQVVEQFSHFWYVMKHYPEFVKRLKETKNYALTPEEINKMMSNIGDK